MLNTTYQLLNPDGRRRSVTVYIDAPRRAKGGEWRCRVRLTGLAPQTSVGGVDALQALCLALEHVSQSLYAVRQHGSRILYDEDNSVPLHAYFRIREYHRRLRRIKPRR